MLVLTRRVGEEIVIDKQIRVVVSAIRGGRVQLAICSQERAHSSPGTVRTRTILTVFANARASETPGLGRACRAGSAWKQSRGKTI